jgi:hypothetical protein
VLRPYKTTQVEVTEEGNYKRRIHFCNWFLWAVHDDVLDPKLTLYTDGALFHPIGYISTQK